MNKTASIKKSEEKNLFLCALRGLAAAVICALCTAAISAGGALFLDDPDKYIKILALIYLFASSGAGGKAAARARGRGAFVCGICVGIMTVGAMVLICLCFSLAINPALFAICAPTMIVTSVLGAVTGVGKPQKAKRKKKRL